MKYNFSKYPSYFPVFHYFVYNKSKYFNSYGTVASKMHSNEEIIFSYKQVNHDYSLPRAYAVICGRFIITVN